MRLSQRHVHLSGRLRKAGGEYRQNHCYDSICASGCCVPLELYFKSTFASEGERAVIDDRDSETGQFLKGKKGGPGRPRGSRNKLGEAFIEALHDDFQEHGVDTIVKVREDRPHEYLKVVASLLPKELHVKDVSVDDLTDGQLSDIIATIRSMGAAGGGEAAKRRARASQVNPSSGGQLN